MNLLQGLPNQRLQRQLASEALKEVAVDLGKRGVVTLGVATALPLIWMVIFFVAFFAFFVYMVADSAAAAASARVTGSGAAAGSRPQVSGPPLWFLGAFLAHFLVMLLIFALTVLYIVDLFQTNRVSTDKKALWAVVLFLGNMFAMPVYWYLYFWRPLSPRKSNGRAPLPSAG